MNKYLIIFFLPAIVFILFMQNCVHEVGITKSEFLEDSEDLIYGVVTLEGKTYVFDEIKPYYTPRSSFEGDSLKGYVNEAKVTIPFDSIQVVVVREFDFMSTCLSGLGVAAVALGVIAATKESCPFIYSYDGEKYVFDGEPYGGAICQALTRTDYSHLEKIEETHGKYLLRLANEVYEIQNTDQLTLLVFDHESNFSVIPDEFGNFYKINETVKPQSFIDSEGKSYLKWVDSTDYLYWTSELIDNSSPERLKDSLFLTFKNREDANFAKLLVNAGTTIWGSNMLLQMTALRGNKADEWFELLKNPVIYEQLEYWNRREELYRINVKVQIDGKWEKRGEIIGGGPFDIDTRVVPLDISGAGEEVKILITPPIGFWKINYAAIDFTTSELVNYNEIYPSVVTNQNQDVTEVLTEIDGIYLTHPNTGDKAFLEFESPKQEKGLVRTIYAKTTGYYELLFDKHAEPDNEMISKISFKPGYPIIFSKEKSKEFRQKFISRK